MSEAASLEEAASPSLGCDSVNATIGKCQDPLEQEVSLKAIKAISTLVERIGSQCESKPEKVRERRVGREQRKPESGWTSQASSTGARGG